MESIIYIFHIGILSAKLFCCLFSLLLVPYKLQSSSLPTLSYLESWGGSRQWVNELLVHHGANAYEKWMFMFLKLTFFLWCNSAKNCGNIQCCCSDWLSLFHPLQLKWHIFFSGPPLSHSLYFISTFSLFST